MVVGTVREESARRNFESERPGLVKAVVLDVTDFDAIGPKIVEIERTAGPISVLVNNAGYGHEGYITMPGIAYYCGSKFALEAISETLSKEVKDFGIRVTAIAPGQFRTDRDYLRLGC